MNIKRYIFSVIAIIVFIFLSDFLIHGKLLKDSYMQTQSLWRSEAEMGEYFPVMLTVQIILSLLITYIFVRGYEARGICEGVRYGFIIGLFRGTMMAAPYAYMPVPLYLGIAWLVSGLIQGIGCGVILALIYKK